MKRRSLLKGISHSAIFLGLRQLTEASPKQSSSLYGPLKKDPNGILDLPQGFSYQIVSKKSQPMDDGLKVPGIFDDMACFQSKNGQLILIRNHELSSGFKHSCIDPSQPINKQVKLDHFYDPGNDNDPPFLGGTTTVIYDPTNKKTIKQFMSLIGTDRNCSGGAMPWGSWITCEEPADTTSKRGINHGYCFEVKASEHTALQKAIPLKALGRFRHEAVALDPRTNILYLTEDRNDGLLYRFIPDKPKDFSSGTLQALCLKKDSPDPRNYNAAQPQLPVGIDHPVTWITLDNTDAPKDDLRVRGHAKGASYFARGEGITFQDDHLYIACTDGGPSRKGQIFKLTPSLKPEENDALNLFIQPTKTDLLTNGDNICVSPNNKHLVICEDLISTYRRSTSPHLRIVTQSGTIHTLARNAINKSEFAGSCFSPDGSILFANIQRPGYTLAITGPWKT